MLRRPISATPRRILSAILSTFPAVLFIATSALATGYWTEAAGELARKIASTSRTPTTMALSVQNLSSLGDSDVAELRQALRVELRKLGWRPVARQRAAVDVRIRLSENSDSYLWVAEILRGESREVKMIAVARPKTMAEASSPETLVIRKVQLFWSEERPLDASAVVDADEGGQSLLVLEPQKIALLRKQDGAWTVAQSVPVPLQKPLPRDPRGRLLVRGEGSFEAYLPGIKCDGRFQPNLTAECRASDESWFLDSNPDGSARAHFVPDRNFFDGQFAIEPGLARDVPPFYSAARLPDGRETLWLLAGVDGHARLFGRNPKPLADFENWGSLLVGLRSGCRSGWQVLATRAGDFSAPDAVEVYEIANQKAVRVGMPVELRGPVISLSPGPNGGSATAVVRDLERQKYEAFTLSIACGQ